MEGDYLLSLCSCGLRGLLEVTLPGCLHKGEPAPRPASSWATGAASAALEPREPSKGIIGIL